MKQHISIRMALMAIAAIAGSSAALAAETNIWATSFEDPLHPYDEHIGPWPNVGQPIVYLDDPALVAVPDGSSLTAFGDSYLRGSGLDLASFALSGVGLGSGPQPVLLHLQFDLAFEDGWDPSGANPATDGFAFSFDGTPILWNAANGFGSGPGGPGTILSTGANVLGQPGSDPGLADTLVHYDFVFSHNRSDLLLGFQLTGAPFIPVAAAGPGWGLDNISLSAITDDVEPGGVPEAPLWALMLAGFGVVGVSARRRQAVFD